MGSKRYLRGRIIALLCEDPAGCQSLSALTATIGEAGLHTAVADLLAIARELADDGLVEVVDKDSELHVRLPR
jgi:hypothetical protein